MKKILVIGSSGMVASRFIELANGLLDICGIDERTVDITNNQAVEKYFNEHKFDAVVNFAAYTNVDGAEKEKGDVNGLTWRLNVDGPKNLAQVCKQKDMLLVQISTDFVFSGTREFPGPYKEESQLPNSEEGIGWYGWTKNRAEHFIKTINPRYSIVRIAYPFYAKEFSGKLDFVKNYLKLYDEAKLFPIFTDQIFSTLLVDDLIPPLVKILNNELEAVFHVVSSDTATPFEFVEYLLKKARGVNGVVQKGSMEEFLKSPGRTPRPLLGGLTTKITEERLGIKFKTWKQMIDEFVDQLKNTI